MSVVFSHGWLGFFVLFFVAVKKLTGRIICDEQYTKPNPIQLTNNAGVNTFGVDEDGLG